jgi:hypothetical protein
MGNAALRSTRPLEWRLLVEERPVWGASEIADALGVGRTTVRQWVYRQKHYPPRGMMWGFPWFFPKPDATVGGRPVWLSDRGITWWMALEILPAVSPWLGDASFFESDERVLHHMHPEDVRRLWTGDALAEESPMFGGIAAMESAKHRGLPPLVIACAVTAWEADMMDLSTRRWRSRVLEHARKVDPLADWAVLSAIRILRNDEDLWPWVDER